METTPFSTPKYICPDAPLKIKKNSAHDLNNVAVILFPQWNNNQHLSETLPLRTPLRRIKSIVFKIYDL